MPLLLFDIDGTLMLSGGAGSRSLDLALERVCGFAHAMEGVPCHGRTDPAILHDAFLRLGLRPPSPTLMTEILNVYQEILAEELAKGSLFRHMPGAMECLDLLHRTPGVALALGTGNVEGGAFIKLRRAGMDHYFPVGGYGSDHLERWRLLERGWEKARIHYGRDFSRKETWVIGDTPLDVMAAREAGFQAIGVGAASYSTQELREAGADHAIDTLHQLPALLDLSFQSASRKDQLTRNSVTTGR